jgi:hypothetical protein
MPPGGEAEARIFYGELLGLSEKPAPQNSSGSIWFEVGENELELHLFEDDDIAPNPRQHFCLAVGDLDELRSRLLERGHAIAEPTVIPNRPRFFTSDPFNNRVEMAELRGNYAS